MYSEMSGPRDAPWGLAVGEGPALWRRFMAELRESHLGEPVPLRRGPTVREELRILGMRALGVHASTMLEAVSLMIQHGRSARDLAELLHPHPAVTEGLQAHSAVAAGGDETAAPRGRCS